MTNLETYCYACNNPSNLYLCPACTQELQTDLNQLTGDFITALHLIALREASRADHAPRSTTQGPSEPVSLTLLNLHDTLLHCCKDATVYAANPYDAAHTNHLRRKIKNAVETVNQNEENQS